MSIVFHSGKKQWTKRVCPREGDPRLYRVRIYSGYPHFEEIYLPSTLETIGDKAFYVVESFKVHYNGSESDWNKIEFGEKWIDALTVPTFDFTK